jgi:sphingomyelin phosphodiesterase
VVFGSECTSLRPNPFDPAALAMAEATSRTPLLGKKPRPRQWCFLRPRTVVILLLGTIIVVSLLLYTILARRSLVLSLLTSLGTLSSCTSCTTLLAPLKTLAQIGDRPFTSALTTVCVRFNIQDAEVCAGAIGSQAPIIAHSLRSVKVSGPMGRALCSRVFGLCNDPVAPEWHVPLEREQAPTNRTKRVSRGRDPFKVVQVADIHLDRQYLVCSFYVLLIPFVLNRLLFVNQVGSEANCSRAICCRKNNGLPFLKTPPENPAGPVCLIMTALPF